MSWFGEQFSSFTEKITDLTKDMLPDSGNNSTDDTSSAGSSNLSPEHLLELCKEKDAEISLLMNEKVSLEKSIEELDLQHEEAIKELLHLKNEAVKENFALKEKLDLQEQNVSIKSLFQKFEHNYNPKQLKTEAHPVTLAMYSNNTKNFNLVNIIGILWKNFGAVTLNSLLELLNEQKLLLESEDINIGDNSNSSVLNRINNYIMFLQLMADNPELLSPIIDEIATVISSLLSNHVSENSRLLVPDNINRQSAYNNYASVRENDTVDFSSQISIQDFKHVKDLFSTTPEPFLCNNTVQSVADDVEMSSQHVCVILNSMERKQGKKNGYVYNDIGQDFKFTFMKY